MDDDTEQVDESNSTSHHPTPARRLGDGQTAPRSRVGLRVYLEPVRFPPSFDAPFLMDVEWDIRQELSDHGRFETRHAQETVGGWASHEVWPALLRCIEGLPTATFGSQLALRTASFAYSDRSWRPWVRHPWLDGGERSNGRDHTRSWPAYLAQGDTKPAGTHVRWSQSDIGRVERPVLKCDP